MSAMNTDWSEGYFTGTSEAGFNSLPGRRYYTDTALPNPQGEMWKDRAHNLLSSQPFLNSTILEVGCGLGYMTEDLIDFGVDAYGVDISPWAISQIQARRPDLASRFSVLDVRTGLTVYGRNQFDYLWSHDFVSCLTDAELTAFFTEGRRVSRNQVHVTMDGLDDARWYNPKTIAEYVSMRPHPSIRFVNIQTGAVA